MEGIFNCRSCLFKQCVPVGSSVFECSKCCLVTDSYKIWISDYQSQSGTWRSVSRNVSYLLNLFYTNTIIIVLLVYWSFYWRQVTFFKRNSWSVWNVWYINSHIHFTHLVHVTVSVCLLLQRFWPHRCWLDENWHLRKIKLWYMPPHASPTISHNSLFFFPLNVSFPLRWKKRFTKVQLPKSNVHLCSTKGISSSDRDV